MKTPNERHEMVPAYFRRTAGGFEPLELSRSDWNWEQLHGVAVSGLLACGAEDAIAAVDRADFVPARFHVDLFRPTRALPTTLRTEMVRNSSRLALVDVHLVQDDEITARASGLFLRPSENPDGELWSPADRPGPPPVELAPQSDEPRMPFISSEQPWSNSFGDHQNAGRHAIWHTAIPLILDEPISMFQAVAAIADTTNMINNWGTGGISYINADLSLTLARRPIGREIGLRTLDHVQHDGVAVSTAEIYDRAGSLGTTSVTALANARRSIDYAK